MIIECTLDTKYFLDVCSKLTFKPDDEKEAKDILGFSSGSVLKVLKSAPNRWAEHYLIREPEKNKIVCVITLDTSNNLHYFVTTDLKPSNSISFVKTIKTLVEETVKYRHVVFVTTRLWYKEAIKFNRLIGFQLLKTNKGRDISHWFYSNKKGH